MFRAEDCFIKRCYACRVSQHVNGSATAVGGSVGWHLAEMQPPLGTRILPPGHVVKHWEGGLFCELQWVPERSQ